MITIGLLAVSDSLATALSGHNEAHVVSRMEASVALGLRKRRRVDWRDEFMGQWMGGDLNRIG